MGDAGKTGKGGREEAKWRDLEAQKEMEGAKGKKSARREADRKGRDANEQDDSEKMWERKDVRVGRIEETKFGAEPETLLGIPERSTSSRKKKVSYEVPDPTLQCRKRRRRLTAQASPRPPSTPPDPHHSRRS